MESILKKFLDIGSPLVTTISLLKTNTMISFLNPEDVSNPILPESFARIHSENKGVYVIWILSENNAMKTVRVECPLHLMGQYFKSHNHSIFQSLC